MEVADFKQTEFFASELTELHQLVTETAQTEAANQSKPKKSDIFSLHTNEQYANALKRVIVFTKSRASGMLAEIIKISSTKTEQLTYELIVANIYVADVLLTFYLYQGWLDQLTEKLSEKIIDRLRIIGDDVRPLKNETVFDVAYQTMISQWSTLVKLLCIEKHFRSIWTYFFGYWKDPNTENFTSRVKLLQYMQFSKAETSEARVVEGVLRTIAQSVKSAKKVEMKADIMELLINLVFSLPENSFGKELHTVRGMVNSYFSKSQQLEVLGARFDAAVHLKTNLSEIQPIMKTINGLNDINAKTEPIFSYIEALCTVHLQVYLLILKKRISPFRVLPLKQFSEKYINALLTVVINCPPKVEKEEVERRANVVLFCAAHNFPVTYNLLDTFFEDKEDKLSLAVLYHSIQLIVDNRFLWINVSAEKEHRKRQFNDLYNSTYEVVKQIDEQTSSQRPLAIPEHVKEFMAKGCGHDTYIKSTLEKAVIRWKEIQEGNAGALNSKIIKETSVEVVDILKRWGNEIDVEGIEKEKSIVKNLLLSEIPDDLITPKDDVKEKVVDRRKKVIKDEKTKEKIDDDTILLVQLIRYLSHYAKLYIINTQKLHMPSFFAFISSKSDYLANAVMETIYRMVYSNEEFRTLVVWDLMKMFLELIDADVPYQNTMEFVDSVMCLWTVLRVEETNRSQINEEIKSKKNKKSKKPVVVYTEHLSEYIEAIITVLQQRFDQSVRIQAPELFTFLYFSSLKEFDNTVWKTLHQHRQYIEQLSRYWFILMTTKIPDSLINIKKQLPVITQEQVQVVNQNLLSMDYIQTYLIMKLLRNTPGTTVITDKVAKIVRRQLGKELTNETRYRLLNIYFSTLSLQNTSNKTQEELNAIYTLENPEFKHLGDVSLPLIRPLLKELIENTSYQDSNESKIIWLFSCMHHDVFYFFVQELKNVVLPLFSSEKSSIEKRRELMLNSMRMLNNALMKDYHTLFTTEISTQLILNILSIINETFSHVKLLWPTFNITSTTRTSFDSASNFPAYFAQNFVSLLYYFCKTIQKMPHFHLEKPTNSVLPVSLELHFLLWPLDQRTDICRYCIENFITPQMNNNPLCNIISLTALEAVSAIFSLSPLSLTEKFFIKPKHIVELEKMHSGILKWIIRYHPDLVFSPKNPDIENLTESTVVIRAISSVYSRIFLPTYNDSGVDAIDLEHVKYLEQGGLQETIENDPIFIENLKKFGGSILHHALITLMADTEEIRLLLNSDQTLHDQIIKNRLSITTTIEQNRLLAATEIVRLCVKCCEPYARTVFYKGTLAGGGNKLSDIQKRWLVTYIINWLPFITLSKDFNDKEINRILSILVYDVTSVMKHNSNQAIAFWNRVCSKKPNEKDNVLVNEYSNYNIIFSFLKSELPKAKDSESFLIVFQALMKVDLKHTFFINE
ncbi:Non-specific serine/threonine protein kinase [Entamoeba marina]